MKSNCIKNNHGFTKQLLAVLFALALPVASFAGGCCAGHGGAAGCNASGQQVCKDKSISPTCKCKTKAATKKAAPAATTAKPAKNAATTAPKASTQPSTKKGGLFNSGLFKSKSATGTTTNSKGCCSRHGGIASCNTSTGMQMCKDGSSSPTCKCH